MNKESVEQSGGDERAAFEAWLAQAMSHHFDPDLDLAKYEDSGEYRYNPAADYWKAWQARAALAQPSPAKPEQAEAERPEVVAYLFVKPDGTLSMDAVRHKPSQPAVAVMTVAQHERIVGELRAVIAQLRQHKNDYMDAGQETYRALQNEIREREAEIARLDGLVSGRMAERDAALARVAELEAKPAEPTAVHQWQFSNAWFDGSEDVVLKAGREGSPIRTLYAAPVAQAQQLHDLDKQCRDDVARALGLRPSQERGFAWSYLLASIKSCVKASEAQHSVPEGWMLVECGIWTQEQVDEMQKTVARFRNSEFVDDRALAMAVADAGQCKAPEISLAELLAAAPGKEG
ncbi:TPA: hypothetical protein ACGJ1X_003925 [Pseudomonas aeruginosa]|uniref:hypothetical protein n=1 Tax=Pseudomonas aeruginosa TaxID=287 RepID=UPI000A77DD36|nr:hypothetical protein [Pseudomonas aeruginosa]